MPKSNLTILPTSKKFKDLTGLRFGVLTAIKIAFKDKWGTYYWDCRCDCGKISQARSKHLTQGAVKSCGCQQAPFVHGQARRKTRTPEYAAWQALRDRCNNPANPQYVNYGGRRIAVCAEWDSFARFFADMGPRPPKREIERRDNNQGYSKDNCYWATRKQQCNNTRQNMVLTIDGETKSATLWAEQAGVNPQTLRNRIRAGWSHKEAISPVLRVNQWHR